MIKLTVYFESPYWVGVFESIDKKLLRTAKVTFGSEPKDYDVYDFILENFCKLKFGQAVKVNKKNQKKINPKRMIRLVNEQMNSKPISTKAQEAMRLEQEKTKTLSNKNASMKKKRACF